MNAKIFATCQKRKFDEDSFAEKSQICRNDISLKNRLKCKKLMNRVGREGERKRERKREREKKNVGSGVG